MRCLTAFTTSSSEEHEQMRRARMLRARRPDEQSRTAPTGNTLGSCVDNMIADQIDNLPEAVMLPEREETAQQRRGDGRRGELCALPRGMAGQVSDADGGRHRDGHGRGAGISGTKSMEDGEGMVNVLAWHPEDFYPDPMYEDMQDGRGCFKATHTSVAWVEEHYPQAKGYVTGDAYGEGGRGRAGRRRKGTTRVTLLEFWYKQYDAGRRSGRTFTWRRSRGGRCCSARRRVTARKAGHIPKALYAHGAISVRALQIPRRMAKAVRHGADSRLLAGRRRPSTDTPSTSTTTRANRAYSGTSSGGEAA